ncbi:flocculation protein FLO11-like [Pollicipes pollicipes]|uniref:flocculation protein FLO11-like n=1 Tax=Pollicipes pollicipes TaxID=41117 RepID=UPI001884C353|nr:flocculation protein FLO11-like [Pollicipes pollicipes]
MRSRIIASPINRCLNLMTSQPFSPLCLRSPRRLKLFRNPCDRDSRMPTDRRLSANPKHRKKLSMGHRESETAEKKSQIFEQSATPTMTSSKTVEETSFQTTSHETSNERAPELSGSLPFSRPEVHPQVTFQRPSFTQARTEATERSSLGSKSNTFSVGAPAPLTNLQPPSQPQVDKQETFSYSKTSEATDKGLRESEVTEKKGQTFEKSISETPGMTEVKTVEEQSSQLISKSSETSQDSVLERKPMIRPSSRIQTPGDQLDQLTPLLKMETNNTNQQSKEEKHIQTTSKLDAFTKSLLEGPPTLVAPQAPFSHADVPQTFSNYQPQEQPYVDRQETFSKSKTSEKTEQGLKESETTEKKSQTFQQSATPTMTSSKTVEEQCIQKTSIETSGEKLPHVATPVPQLSAQPEAKPHSISSRATMPQVNTETTQQMSLETTSERHEASKYAAPPNLNETLVPPVPLATSEVPQQRSEVPDRPHSLERSVLETDSELKTFRTLPPRVGPKPFSSNLAYPVGTPAPFKRVQPSFQPCVDKESQHKMAEKASIVIDKHNITESHARPFKPTVPRPSKMTEPKTVKEQTYQSSSKTSETSQQKYPEEYPVTPDMTPAYDFVQPAPVPQSTTETRQQQMSQSRTQSLERTNLGPAQVPVPEAVHPATIAGRDYQQHERAESKEQKSVSEVSKHLLVEKRQPEFFSRPSVSPARFAHVEAPRTLPKHEPPAQPCVEKQKDSRQCETTQQTVYDRKLLEVTGEADQTSGQPAVSTMASSKTVEEMLSKSHGFSKDRLPQPPFSVPYPFSQPETQPYETIEFSPLPQAKTINTEQMSTSSTSESSVLSRQASPQVPEAMPPRVAAKPLSSGPAHPVGIPKLVADLHPSAQPYVDKQETFSHSKTSETTDKGCRQSEIAEKKVRLSNTLCQQHQEKLNPGLSRSRRFNRFQNHLRRLKKQSQKLCTLRASFLKKQDQQRSHRN